MTIEPIRVLIADDEPDVRLLLRLQLEAEGDFEVVGEAKNGQEALERCAELEPSVVVMDLLMPVMSGFEAIGHLEESHPHIGVVAYSAVGADYARAEMARRNVELVLKSGDIELLADALRRHAASRR